MGSSEVGARRASESASAASGASPRPTIHQPSTPSSGRITSTGSSRRAAVSAASSVRSAVGCATWMVCFAEKVV